VTVAVAGIRYLERVGSTQDVVHALAAEGAPGGLAVVAAEQHDGRGSRRQTWHSPLGGLWLSFLWRPQVAPAVEILSVRAGLAVATALEHCGVDGAYIKWPNDLLVDGRKAGGVLCEARWQGDQLGWVTVGVGLNVTNPVPPGVRHPAIALAERHPGLRPDDLAEPVVAALRALEESAVLSAAELAAFARRDWLRGRRLLAPVGGVADGVEPHGVLRVRTAGGAIEHARAGPVTVAGE
jgi:BirA family biotin operon repressor/biotin-[acetyl-CoA-carboxylase] ligase